MIIMGCAIASLKLLRTFVHFYKNLYYLYFLNDLIINKARYKIAMQIRITMQGLRIKLAKIKPTQLIAAMSKAYGNLVEIWLIILHFVPVAAMIVVSEIGET